MGKNPPPFWGPIKPPVFPLKEFFPGWQQKSPKKKRGGKGCLGLFFFFRRSFVAGLINLFVLGKKTHLGGPVFNPMAKGAGAWNFKGILRGN